MRCINFILCKKLVYKNFNKKYCKFCIHYFNYRLKIKTPKNINCPLCLTDSEKNIKFIKNKNCNHYICFKCIKQIYFDKKYYKKMPINDLLKHRKSWNYFMNNKQSFFIRNKLINPMIYYGFNKKIYDIFLKKYTNLIPYNFKKKFKRLIMFQVNKENYISKYKLEQEQKIKLIKLCPYCRK